MKKILMSLLIVISILFITGCSDLDLDTNDNDKFTHKVTKSYVGDYDMGYYIEGTVKNETDKNFSYVQIEFICYDKEGNNMGTAMDNTNNLLGNQTWKFKAMGLFDNVKSVDHCDFHEVTSW